MLKERLVFDFTVYEGNLPICPICQKKAVIEDEVDYVRYIHKLYRTFGTERHEGCVKLRG